MMIILNNISHMYVEKHYVRYIIIFSCCLKIIARWCYDALICICCIHTRNVDGGHAYWVEKNMPSPVIFSQSNGATNMRKVNMIDKHHAAPHDV